MNDVPTRQQVYNKTWNVERIQWLHFAAQFTIVLIVMALPLKAS